MIELTKQQVQAMLGSNETPLLVLDPKSKTTYILVRKELYVELTGEKYDDSPWTDEEMELLAWEAGKQAGWEDMNEYDHYTEKK